jgi:hypothetical protein
LFNYINLCIMNIKFRNTNLRKFQEGGAMPAPEAEAME